MPRTTRLLLLAILPALCTCLALSAAESAAKDGSWHQWRGPNRNGISDETGLLSSWPQSGPKLAWKATGCGTGFAAVTVADGQVYTTGYKADGEHCVALDAKTGEVIWSKPVGAAARVGYAGSRCSPTVDGKHLYVVAVEGNITCLNRADGSVAWTRSFKDWKGRMMSGWGYSESPMVDGDRVLCTPGGQQATIVCLDKNTGEEIWKAAVPAGRGRQGDEAAAYASIISGTVAGVKQYFQLCGTGVVGVAADKGTFLWRYDRVANGTANCSTPLFHDGHVFAASAYGTGGGLLKLAKDGEKVTATEVYFTREMKNHHGGMVILDKHIFGFDDGILACLDFATGKRVWQNRSVGKGSIVCVDGHFIVRSEGGPVALVEANSSEYVEKGRFSPPEPSDQPKWAHPVVAGGRLYLRDQDKMFVYDVSGGS